MHVPKLVRTRVRREDGFTASDPWNGNRRADFTIEVYKMLPPDSPRGTGAKDSWVWGLPMFGIKSEIDGRQRMLPESLVELWQTHRIPAEALPRLLWQLQSSLKPDDYMPTLRSTTFHQALVAFVLFLCICLGLVAFYVGHMEPRYAILWTLGGMVISLPAFLVILRRRARCRRQIDWVLTHL